MYFSAATAATGTTTTTTAAATAAANSSTAIASATATADTATAAETNAAVDAACRSRYYRPPTKGSGHSHYIAAAADRFSSQAKHGSWGIDHKFGPWFLPSTYSRLKDPDLRCNSSPIFHTQGIVFSSFKSHDPLPQFIEEGTM